MIVPNEALFALQAVLMALTSLLFLWLGQSALISWITLQAVLANLLTLKQITLFGMTVTSGDVFAVGSILSFNLLQEYFGRSQARKSIMASFGGMIAYLIFTQCHLAYEPSVHDTLHGAYAAVLATMPRLIIASLTTFLSVQLLDTVIYGGVKAFFVGRFPVARAALCLVISQTIDTIMFTFLGLYGIVHAPWEVIGLSLLVKCSIIACSVPFVGFSRMLINQGNVSSFPSTQRPSGDRFHRDERA